ncbi:MAG: HD domain-containing protein [SAR202 cluster bacterium]|nr:HD domain-containing protein [SAR202 cluster bacterium]|tara:strand:- start:4385 stop:4972 length:588 start_codon:yes stop_codon:yes gene_type:complete
MRMNFDLPDSLQKHLLSLPRNLRAHISRVRKIARELAVEHSLNAELADLGAAAHDVARHLSGGKLLEEAEKLQIPVGEFERFAPIILHGPVGACWLKKEGILSDSGLLEAVYWHTSAHPDLDPIGKVIFIADKIDPAKVKAYPFQPSVAKAARGSLDEGVLAFLDGIIKEQVDQHRCIHPMSAHTRNRLIIENSC